MGVWIEILVYTPVSTRDTVTPLVGVWIEIPEAIESILSAMVTPLVGVWIEISYELPYRGQAHSHSPCGSVD